MDSKKITKCDVFLLAAGESSRMFPLSQIMEKSLLPVDGKPVCRIIVENLLKSNHIGRIIICCLDKFKKQFEHEFRDVDIQILTFEKPIGTLTTLYEAVKSIDVKDISAQILVHYADAVTDIDYEKFLNRTGVQYSKSLIVVTENINLDYSVIPVLKKGIQDFVEKPDLSYFNNNYRTKYYSWCGVALFELGFFIHKAEWLNRLGIENQDIATHLFHLIQSQLQYWRHNGYWYDCGNLNSYRKICNMYDSKNGEK